MKKILSIILSIVLIISVLPMTSIGVNAATYDAKVVVDLAMSKVNTSYANGYCLRFVKEMFASAYGFTSSACCAYKYGSSYIDSTSRSNIPLGASVFFAGSSKTCSTCGNKCGHIGIYVGDDYVVHGWNGKIEKYKIDRIINAGYPYRGWGWHGNIELSSDFEQDTTKPTDLKISANYTSVGIGDTVTFTYSISGASNRSIGIDKDGSRYKTIGVSTDNGSVSYVFTEPGTYCCIIEGSNSVGYDCSHGVWITVINTAPKDCSISANYTSIGIGDSVTFNYSISGATAQCIGIDKDGKRYANVTANSDKGTSTYTFKEKGIYCCIIEGYNNVGYNCSYGVWLTVIDTAPKECYISANKTNIALGETVTFDYKIVGATVQGLGIDKDGTRYANVTAKNDEGKSTYTFNEKGTYCCIIEGYNNVGYNCSHGVFITVGETPVIDNYRIKAINDFTIIDEETKTIYGLEEGVFDLEGYVECNGCELEYNTTANGFGTGTTVDIVKDGEVVDTYTIVIFGDINGDGYIDAFDVPDMISFVNYESQYESGSAQEMAADINGDGFVDESDLFLIDLASTFAYTIEQSR